MMRKLKLIWRFTIYNAFINNYSILACCDINIRFLLKTEVNLCGVGVTSTSTTATSSSWCILQKLRWVKFFYRIFLMKMVKYPQTYPLIPKIPLGWSIKSKFWRIFKCTFMHVKYVVQRFVPRDLIFWSVAYCLTISESSCQHGSDGTQIWASDSMVSS